MMETTIDQAVEIHDGALFQKTPAGSNEIKDRTFKLTPRTRQILILIDGQRTLKDLLKVAGREEILGHLQLLAQNKLIERLDTVEHVLPASSPEAALAPPTFTPTIPQSVPAEPTVSLTVARQRISRALIDTMGPHGESLATRVEKAVDFQDLRELMTTFAPVIEAFGGRTALQGFVQRVGKIF